MSRLFKKGKSSEQIAKKLKPDAIISYSTTTVQKFIFDNNEWIDLDQWIMFQLLRKDGESE